jgi:hypothetical protein
MPNLHQFDFEPNFKKYRLLMHYLWIKFASITIFQNITNEVFSCLSFTNEFGLLFSIISSKKLPKRVFQLAGRRQDSFGSQLW